MLLADAGFWDWASKLTDPSFLAALGLFIGGVLKHWRDIKDRDGIKADLRENSDDTKAIRKEIPAVAEKIDSATKKAEVATETAEKVIGTAATKVAAEIGRQLSDKADQAADKVAEAADKVAEVAASSQQVIVDKVEILSKVIKGDDGTCVSSQVKEHGRQLDDLQKRVGNLENTVGEIGGDTKQILEYIKKQPNHVPS